MYSLTYMLLQKERLLLPNDLYGVVMIFIHCNLFKSFLRGCLWNNIYHEVLGLKYLVGCHLKARNKIFQYPIYIYYGVNCDNIYIVWKLVN